MSIQIEIETTIDRPIEEVFEYITAPENDEKWHPPADRSPGLDGEMRVGATWKSISEGMTGTSEITMECTEYDPPNRFGYRTPTGLFGGRVKTKEAVYTFTGDGDRTHVTWSGTMEVSGFMRLLKPVIPRIIRGPMEESFENLKSLLEPDEGLEAGAEQAAVS